MMKTKTLLIVMLMLMTIGCKRQTHKELIEAMGREKMEYIEKKGLPRIQKQIVNNLKYPESYEPISTDMSIVTSDMIIYNTRAFINLRNLERDTREFKEKYGNDSTSQEARNALHAMQTMKEDVININNAACERPLEFEGIDVYHQFYANDRPDHKAKKGYHIIFHKDNTTTILCDDDEFLRISTFARQLLNNPPYLH